MIIVDGDAGFPLGANSVDDCEALPPGSYVRSMNTVNRGGIVQCRPGYRWRFNLPSGNLQGMTIYRPTSGGEQLVFAVDGKVYTSASPFVEFRQLANLQFNPYAKQLFFCACDHAIERQADGSLKLIPPRKVLIIQDGFSAPGYWNGADSDQVEGGLADFKLPLGTAMAWSGSRLWVARGPLVFVSDIANPFSFFEGQYVGSIGAFILPGPVTGMAEVPSVERPSLLVFTENTTTMFQSNIRARALWPAVQNFQLTVFPNIGCASHKAVAAHNGLLWWFSQYGLTNTNLAYAAQQSGKFQFADDEMAVSKGYLYSDISGVAMASFENYLLTSVPYTDKWNRHTWVRDTKGRESWNSYWTGTRPVEWAAGAVNGSPRIFYVSADLDGGNRLWEAFSSDRFDECTPITWGLELRGYTAGSLAKKQFRWADVYLTELQGTVDVFAEWAGTNKGRYREILEKRVSAMAGSVEATREVRFDRDEFALKKQTRLLRTEEQRMLDADDLGGAGVLDDREAWIDTGFQLCIMVNGPGAIKAIRMFMEVEPEQPQGRCEADEDDSRAERFDGASTKGDTEQDVLDTLQEEEPVYVADSSVTAEYKGETVFANGGGSSRLSQTVADKLALALANCRAAIQLLKNVTPHRGSFLRVQHTTSYTTCAGTLVEI